MPIGFKNGTDGSLQIAIDAIGSASSSHSFLSVTKQGISASASSLPATSSRQAAGWIRLADRDPYCSCRDGGQLGMPRDPPWSQQRTELHGRPRQESGGRIEEVGRVDPGHDRLVRRESLGRVPRRLLARAHARPPLGKKAARIDLLARSRAARTVTAARSTRTRLSSPRTLPASSARRRRPTTSWASW